MRGDFIYSIPEPCHASDEDFVDSAQGWYCNKCEHEVIDASKMTRRAFERLERSHSGNLCAQFQYDEEGEIVFADPVSARWMAQLSGVAKLIATASIPPLLLAGCLESGEVSKVGEASQANSPVIERLETQEKAAASRLAEFHIDVEPEDHAPPKRRAPVTLEGALSELNQTQSERNARTDGAPEHPTDAIIEEPLAPGEKMQISFEHSALDGLNVEVLNVKRSQRHFKGRVRTKRRSKEPIILIEE